MTVHPRPARPPAAPPSGEDDGLLVLSRSAAARTGGAGAAVRDTDGRTYVAGAVSLRALRLSPVQAAVAQAVASGATRLEALAVVGAEVTEDDGALLEEMGSPRVVRA